MSGIKLTVLGLWPLRSWLDSSSGIGRVVIGMARKGYDLQLTRYDERGWLATFDDGMEHSPTSATDTAHAGARDTACGVACVEEGKERAVTYAVRPSFIVRHLVPDHVAIGVELMGSAASCGIR